ncbi:hypothetical protein Cyrtocomes_00327 [Candidatus Cyrtobacter comes]|uniref:LysM domain-containing protein n=2 Tax=Candidatus Cyrtobacter comes TaxID=675776 RepID=A0ABU5L763_9RICK|nr:hypothetical protein [Candidatus Cyrtobacter comes]
MPEVIKTNESLKGEMIFDFTKDTILESTESYLKKVFEYAGYPNVGAIHGIKIQSIGISIDYGMYLKEEREKYGDAGIKDHWIVISQVVVGQILSHIGGLAAGAATLSIGGGIPGAIVGAISVSFTYENINIGDKSLKEHVRSMMADILKKDGLKKSDVETDDLKKADPKNDEHTTKNTDQTNKGSQFSDVRTANSREKILDSVKETKSQLNENFFMPILLGNNNKDSWVKDFWYNKERVTQFNEIIIDMSPHAIRNTFQKLDLKHSFTGYINHFSYQPEIHRPLFKTLDNKGVFLDGHTIINPSSGIRYTLQSGETLMDIATKYNIPINELTTMKSNEHLAQGIYVDGHFIPLRLGTIVNIPVGAYSSASTNESTAQKEFTAHQGSQKSQEESQKKQEEYKDNTNKQYKPDQNEYVRYGDHGEAQYYPQGRAEDGGPGLFLTIVGGALRIGVFFVFHFPIVIDLKGNGLKLIGPGNAFFDLTGDGILDNTGWIGRGMGLLCFDYNQDGKINESKEIVFTQWLESAQTDFEGLKYFDTNNDGFIDKNDHEFEKFIIWEDKNMDGISEKNELISLKDAGIKSIDLDSRIKLQEQYEGNQVVGAAHIHYFNGSSLLNAYDVGFQIITHET